ncbi:putative sugar transporter [Aspergillus nomiae NRRL 13137]|uniref:Putative sugar transporter n=1 Tax=Aspergillus nomiae NRRL (strain ATCC 15546 / NRRL 13137 / CBS 260.88 / M93) TaxID=1509407 RepID=A0A0L1J1Y0_ASPN3|nr:putative sugar transporter [Aspergillus nomiae NRRL 13137]KNG85816.1 putative sugar transporter [Aspergillus nomiae NRRL 13137]
MQIISLKMTSTKSVVDSDIHSTVDSDTSDVQHLDLTSTESHCPSKERTVNVFLLVTCVVFGAASFLFGFDDKIISPVAALDPFVERYQGPNPSTGRYTLTARNQNIVFSVPLVGSILGGLAASPLNFRLGRKRPVLMAYVISISGGLLQVFAPSLAAFVAGRFINGIAWASPMAPLPCIFRRSVTSINILNVTAGVIGTVVVSETKKQGGRESYLIPLAVQCALPVLLLICTLPLPESPQWLVAKGRLAQARSNLRKLRGLSDEQVDVELEIMKLCEQKERELKANVKFWEIFSRKHLHRTLTAGSFFSLNQVSGVILSTTYVTVFLTEIGMEDSFALDAFSLTVIASCCTLAGTIAAPFVIDRAGRRPTALVGMSVLLVIDALAGGLAFSKDRRSRVAIVALSLTFNFFWASSFSSLSTLMPSEMATPKLRHHTMAYTIACAQTTAVITTLVVPRLTAPDAANLGAKAYLIFAGCMVCIVIFTFCFLPETKGRTFAEIDELYDAGVPAWKWRTYKSSLELRTYPNRSKPPPDVT